MHSTRIRPQLLQCQLNPNTDNKTIITRTVQKFQTLRHTPKQPQPKQDETLQKQKTKKKNPNSCKMQTKQPLQFPKNRPFPTQNAATLQPAQPQTVKFNKDSSFFHLRSSIHNQRSSMTSPSPNAITTREAP